MSSKDISTTQPTPQQPNHPHPLTPPQRRKIKSATQKLRSTITTMILSSSTRLAVRRLRSTTVVFRHFSASTTTTTTTSQEETRQLPFSSAIASSLAAHHHQQAEAAAEGQTTTAVFDIASHLPIDYTPGHVLGVLNQVGKGGYKEGATISEDQIRFLLQSARPQEPKDATVIITALVNYKRINRFLLTSELASECIDAILKSDPRTGGLLVLENFTQDSGFYFAASLDSIHLALNNILDEAVDDHDQDRRIWKALVHVVQQLVRRKQKPYKEMKKRAKRAHLFQLQNQDGPSGQTVELLLEIGLIVSNAEAVHDELIQPCCLVVKDSMLVVPEDLLVALNAKRLVQQAESVVLYHDDDDDTEDESKTTTI